MKTFKEYATEQDIQEKIGILLYLAEHDDIINESFLENLSEDQKEELVEDINTWLNKVGLKATKGKGIIDYIASFSKGAGSLIIAAIKGDKEKVKEISTKITKEKVLDFLLKLDLATLHIVAEPLHMIDAILGWNLEANIESSINYGTKMLDKFYDGIKNIKDSISILLKGNKQKRLLVYAHNLEKNMPNR